MQFRPEDGSKAEKCNFCADRLANKEAPVCVAACPMRALDYGVFKDLSLRPGTTLNAPHLPDGSQTTASLVVKSK
jgi:anaerobic dimethyl sulfoxide reductase subunit B (iron-sulfur subunit)